MTHLPPDGSTMMLGTHLTHQNMQFDGFKLLQLTSWGSKINSYNEKNPRTELNATQEARAKTAPIEKSLLSFNGSNQRSSSRSSSKIPVMHEAEAYLIRPQLFKSLLEQCFDKMGSLYKPKLDHWILRTKSWFVSLSTMISSNSNTINLLSKLG